MKQTVSKSARTQLAAQVAKIIARTPAYDIHTHLYDPAFGPLLLWGIDDLLVYHYLVAEAFRYLDIDYDRFWALPKESQADLIWKELFLRHSPISESCRGVLSTLNLLGIDVRQRDLPSLRKWFSSWKVADYVDRCLEAAQLKTVCMTNSPFDDTERAVWMKGFARDDRFTTGLRLDPLLLDWLDAARRLNQWGYAVESGLSGASLLEVRRFLLDWTQRTRAKYLMVSLPPDFQFPNDGFCAQLIEQAVLPHCREFGLPFAMMLGVKRSVNPQLKLAGDGVGPSRLESVENLCAQFPDNKFLVTVLARENQHQLCVDARKFRNLHLFGCWWFNNVPSLIDEITRMRLELVGLSITPQHSDARVLDQVVYKWAHFRKVLTAVLTDKYLDLQNTGWEPTLDEIERDVRNLLGGAFDQFCGTPPVSPRQIIYPRD